MSEANEVHPNTCQLKQSRGWGENPLQELQTFSFKKPWERNSCRKDIQIVEVRTAAPQTAMVERMSLEQEHYSTPHLQHCSDSAIYNIHVAVVIHLQWQPMPDVEVLTCQIFLLFIFTYYKSTTVPISFIAFPFHSNILITAQGGECLWNEKWPINLINVA